MGEQPHPPNRETDLMVSYETDRCCSQEHGRLSPSAAGVLMLPEAACKLPRSVSPEVCYTR